MTPPAVKSLKIVVAGPFAAGKTTFIGSVADGGIVATETYSSEGDDLKRSTTAALDFGSFMVDAGPDRVELLLFGLPGQARFDFMWHILGRGALGYVLLVDASDPGTWPDALRIDATLNATSHLPRVVALNRLGGEQDPSDLGEALGLDPSVPVVRCDPRERASAIDVLLTLFLQIVRHPERAAAPSADRRPRTRTRRPVP